ncbi:O-antigen ligase family protein [Candidatus Microgenomates bacterium]|nr:O-antigen ligase family protein [Candidatus Microgenomates bacterium]
MPQKLIAFFYYALFFFTPLLFNKANSELFELPKMYFVWVITIIIVSLWLVRIIAEKRVIFQRTFLDIPLILYLIFQLISTYFSIDQYTSIWGYYSRLNGGLISTISYLLLYWAYISNLTTQNTLSALKFLLISGLLVALWGIPSHFGYDPNCVLFGYNLTTNCWSTQFVPTERIFSTLGQPNWLANWLVALMPLTWAMFFTSKIKNLKSKIFYLYLSLILIIAIIFTRSSSGFLGLVVALVVFTTPQILHLFKKGKFLVWLTILPILTMSIFFVQKLPKVVNGLKSCTEILTSEGESHINSNITPSSDIRCIVWKGAFDIWRHYPLIGSGPETFAYSYYQFRPAIHNLTSEWDLLYNKAHNEYLNFLANSGLAGLTTYLILIIMAFWLLGSSALRKNPTALPAQAGQRPNALIAWGLLAGFASLLVTNFFGFSVVATQLQFFLYPAMVIGPLGSWDARQSDNQRPNALQVILIFLVLFITIFLLVKIYHYYQADLHYSRAQTLEDNQQYVDSLSEIRKSLNLRPNEPLYKNELSVILSSLSFLTAKTDSDLSAQMTNIAITSSDQALATSPYNLNFLKSRASMFIKLSQPQEAIKTLEYAQKLVPTEPKIAYNLGLTYIQLDQNDQAIQEFKKATQLRPLYRDAWLALGLAQWQKGDKTTARHTLNYILQNIDSQDKEVLEQLKKWK